MRDEIELLKEVRPHAGGPGPDLTREERAALMAAVTGARRSTPWWRRRTVRVAVPAFAAAVTAVVLGLTLTGRSGEQAWAAALVRVAEAAPRLLVDEDGWEVTRADQFSVDFGEMELANGERELEIQWFSAGDFGQEVDNNLQEMDDLGTASAAGSQARLFRYRDSGNEYVALWMRGDYTVQVRGAAATEEAFRALLSSLHEVDVDTWLSAMPESVVQPAAQEQEVADMLADIPLPPGFDSTEIPTTDAVRDRYQLGAHVAGTVACAWIERWLAARSSGDVAAVREAVDAMATSPDWQILDDMNDEGDYPEVLWEFAAAMQTNGTVPGGRPMTVEEAYKPALGCP